MSKNPKKELRFIGETAELLAQKLKFYLTEFGRQEDLEEIATEINKIRQNVFIQKEKEDNLPAE